MVDNREHFVAVPFYDYGTSGSPLLLRDLFQEFLNLMDLAQSLARGETRLRPPFVGRDLILDFRMRRAGAPAKAGGFRRPREKTGSNSSVNFDAPSAAACRHVFLGLPQFVATGGVAF